MITKISKEEVARKCEELKEEIYKEMKNKGPYSFNSPHEVLGTIAEEYHELIKAITSDNFFSIREELVDIAVLAIFGVASMDSHLNQLAKDAEQ